jgi:3-isopropylmalate/(R)-2-methylmalate dehydratase large subunit
MITYGTNPGMGLEFLKAYQLKDDVAEGEETYKKSLGYGFNQGSYDRETNRLRFLRSCTNGRIEDFRAFASS